MRACWFVIALVGCGSHHGSDPAKTGCVDPRRFGAVVNDGKDDRAALQRALDAASAGGLDVCLPKGDLHVARRPGKGPSSIPSLLLAGNGGGIRGQGPSSRIVMLDDPRAYIHDWWVLEITGTRHAVRDFAIDGSTPGATDEQTHLIQIVGPARDIQLSQLTLSIPSRMPIRAGDCIRMMGSTTEPVDGVSITDVRGVACARSFIAFQRHVSNVTVERATSVEVGGQAIDMEPTGDGAIHGVAIRHSHFARGKIARGGWTVALAGAPQVIATDLLLSDSIIEDGGVAVYNAQHVEIRRNQISGGVADRGLIKLERDTSDVRIESNVLRRTMATGDGIELTNLHGEWPRGVVIRDNELHQETEGFPIHAEPVEGIEITNNRIHCKSPRGRYAAVFLRGVASPIVSAQITNNTIRGNCSEAVRISQFQKNVTGAVVVEDNVVEGTSFGVTFENGPPREKPVVNRNVFRGVRQADRVVGSDARGFEGKNSD